MISRNATLILVLMTASAAHASTAHLLPLEGYLKQVREKNHAIAGSAASSEGALERAQEGDLIFAPAVFANVLISSDKAPVTGLTRDRLLYNSYVVGVSKTTDFGLAAKLSYQVNASQFDGANPLFINPSAFNDAKPVLELTQSLWRNSFGSESRATARLASSAALATGFGESFKLKVALAEAEGSYWRLALARDTVALQRENLARAITLKNWSQKRFDSHLSDRSDLLQAETALKLRELELQSALDEEAAAARSFNSLREQDAPLVEEQLSPLDVRMIQELKIPPRMPLREDLRAAQQQANAADAGAALGAEKNSPVLELFGQVALNARDPSLSTAVSNSFTTDKPTTAIGIRFATPLDFGSLSKDRAGYRKEQLASDLNLQRKAYEQESDWKDLSAKFNEARARFELVRKLETAQKDKLQVEKERLNKGRSTTYQVLLFEQDYTTTQLNRLRTEAEILRIVAQLRTYSEMRATP